MMIRLEWNRGEANATQGDWNAQPQRHQEISEWGGQHKPGRSRSWNCYGRWSKQQHTTCNSWFSMDRNSDCQSLQYKVMKSKVRVMASLLQDEEVKAFNVLAVQKPWRNPVHYTTHPPMPQHFDLV
jgi:hypothetical protein